MGLLLDRIRRTAATAIAVACAPHVHAGVETQAPHRVIVERKVELLEGRLQELGRAGYRLLDAADGAGGFARSNEFELHLERKAPGEMALEYRVVSGEYSGALVKRLREAGAEGFRVHPRGILRKAVPNPLGQRATPQAETPVLILERDLEGPPDDYELLVPGTARQLGRELGKQAESGFSLVGLRAFQGGWLLTVLARPIIEQPYEKPTKQAGDPPYLALDERDRETLFERVGAAAERGYRVAATAHAPFASRGDVVLMSRDGVPGRPYSYYFLGHPTEDELEERLNEGAAAGYRFRPGLDPRVELILERAPLERVDVRYRTVAAAPAAELERAIAEALAQGWAFAGLHGGCVVLERAGPDSSGMDGHGQAALVLARQLVILAEQMKQRDGRAPREVVGEMLVGHRRVD